jgi:hypothetical protein
MPYLIVSALFVILYFTLLLAGPKARRASENKYIDHAAMFIRACVLLILCGVPVLMIIRAALHKDIWALRAEAAATVTALAVLLIGLFSLAQRYGALYFKMLPVFGLEEIIFMMLLPAVLYISYLPSTFILLYYLAPAIYTGYLMFRMIRGRIQG